MSHPTFQEQKIFWLSFLAVSVWVVLFLVINNQADMDLWGVMSFGALLDNNPGRFPYIDPFSYTALGTPWVYHEWGSGVVFYQLFKYGGSQALFWLKLFLVELILMLSCHLYLLGGLHCKPSLPNRFSQAFYAFCLPLVVYLLLPDVDTTIRCQLFTFVGYALFLYLLKCHSEGRFTYGVWLMPLYMICWANVHGGFIMGLGLLGLYLLYHWFTDQTRQAERVALVLFLSALATLTNPYGFRFWQTMVSAWALPRVHISEWGNIPSLDIPCYGLIYTALFLVGLLLGYLQWRRTKEKFPLNLSLLFFTGTYGWLHYKLAPLFLISFLSIGLDNLNENFALLSTWFPTRWSPGKARFSHLFPFLTTWGLTALLVFGVFLGSFYWRTHLNILAVRVPGMPNSHASAATTKFSYPLGVTGYILRHNLHGNLWVPFSWGEFMYWVLFPQCRISIDGRYETLYTEQIFNDYYRFYHPPYQLNVAERYPTTHILVETSRPELVEKMGHNKEWHEVYRDNQAVLFARHPEPLETGKNPTIDLTLDHYRGDLKRFRVLVGI